MWSVASKRLAGAAGVLVFVSFLIFLMMHLAPGDPASAAAGMDASPEQLERLREQMGLNKSIWAQYFDWATGILKGDMGTSLFSSRSVGAAVLQRLPVTLALTGGAVVLAIVASIPAGILAALKPGGAIDRMVMATTTLGIAMPSFLIGLVLVYVFALALPWFPATGYVPISSSAGAWAHHLILPWLALATAVNAELARHVRASTRDVLQADYVRTARAKGTPEWKVVFKHVLKPAAIPVVTVLGLQVRRLLGGSVVVEQVFGIPALGSLGIKAVFDRDFPMIQGFALTAVVVVVIVNALVDMVYGYLDPRVREGGM